MSPPSDQVTAPRAPSAGRLRLGEIRLIPPVETYPSVVRFAQTAVGRAVLLLVYGFILFLHGDYPKFVAPLLLVAPTFAPAHRRKFVALITLVILLARPFSSALDDLARAQGLANPAMFARAVSLGALALCAGYAYLTLARPESILGRRPVASTIGLFLLLLLGGSLFVPARSGAGALLFWGLLVALSHFLWFLCYTVKNRAPRSLRQLVIEVGHYNPFWYPNGGTGGTPIPKGGSFLDRIEAKTPDDLAVCQLKGLKLSLWAMILGRLGDVLRGLAYGEPSALASALHLPSLGVLPFDDALARSAAGAPLPFYESWAALLAHFFIEKLLVAAVALHLAIGMARMAGFRALRGMYRPFRARSFADFWNRVHYYFKELMVEFFFYPIYFRYFKGRPRLRALAAVFAAACFGNWLYHVLRDVDWIAIHGVAAALSKYKTYAVYTLLLAIGVGASHLRSGGSRPPPAGITGALGSAAILLSYCLLGVFDENGGASIGECVRFLLELFTPIGSAHRALL